jgi:hypothetical protein
MLHFLTAGHLDIAAAKECRVHVIVPLDAAIVARLAEKYRDDVGSAAITFEGGRLVADAGYVRCPWYMPKLNRTSIRFIVELQALTLCVVADIEHGRVLGTADLTELLV